jgi:hypothetical protein
VRRDRGNRVEGSEFEFAVLDSVEDRDCGRIGSEGRGVFDLDVTRALIFGFDGDQLWLVRDNGMGMGGLRGREG